MNLYPITTDRLIAEEWSEARLRRMSAHDLKQDRDDLEWEKMHYDSIIHSVQSRSITDDPEPKHPTPEYLRAKEQSATIGVILERIAAVLQARGIPL